MQWNLEGKTALVTGGGSGIGQTVALRLGEQGVAVGILDLDARAGDETVTRIEKAGGRGQALRADVAEPTQVAGAVAKARASLGPVDYLVNIAGFFQSAPIQEITDSQWQRMLSVHLGGTFYCCRAVLPEMISRRFGRIVNMASHQAYGAGFGYIPVATHYAAAKGGIISFTKALAREVAPAGVLVNAVAPTAIDTPLWRGDLSGAELESRMAQRARVIPIGRLGRPEEVADAVLFLLSAASSFLTGHVIGLTGGELMV